MARKVSFIRASEAGEWPAEESELPDPSQEEIFERAMRSLRQAIELYLELLTEAAREDRLGR